MMELPEAIAVSKQLNEIVYGKRIMNFGCFGGYKTRLSKNTVDKDCELCGNKIKKESYMGGSIYYCEGCQNI